MAKEFELFAVVCLLQALQIVSNQLITFVEKYLKKVKKDSINNSAVNLCSHFSLELPAQYQMLTKRVGLQWTTKERREFHKKLWNLC